jgi:uncharacterized lipoprotein NlpE involved in copper resistance
MVVLVVTGLSSCNKSKEAADIHNSRVSLDWEGVYRGIIPSASGSGIDVRMKLNKDNTYELTYDYIDRPDSSFTFTGLFRWDDSGSVIITEMADGPNFYKVGENKLIQLDMEGNLITGNFADDYVLTKE